MRIYPVTLICTITLSACESPDARDTDLVVRSMNALWGQPVQTAIDKLGPPGSKTDTATGHTYTWRFANGNPLVAGAPNAPPGSACALILETDPENVVRQAHSSYGTGCEPVWKRILR